MHALDPGGPVVLEAPAGGPVGGPVTVDQALVAVLGLQQGPALGVHVEVDELLEAPGARLAVDPRHQARLGGILLVQELRALHQPALGNGAGG